MNPLDDGDVIDPGISSPGMPDPESADSFSVFIGGLLEDPLMEKDE